MVLPSNFPKSCSSSWVAKLGQGSLTRVLTTTRIFYGVRSLSLKDGSVCAVASVLSIFGSLMECRSYMVEDKEGL